MSSASRIYDVRSGGTVEVSRRGLNIDLHYREASGRTVATVVLSEADALVLIDNLVEVSA